MLMAHYVQFFGGSFPTQYRVISMIMCMKIGIPNGSINCLDRIVSLVIIPNNKSVGHKSIRTSFIRHSVIED
jgi:hypothetical protein